MKKFVLLLLVVLVVTLSFVACGKSNCKHDDPTKIVVIEAVDPTCLESGLTEGMKCTLCGVMVVPQRIREMIRCIEGDWIVDMEATVTEDGAYHTECTVCGKKISEGTIHSTGSIGLAYRLNDKYGYSVSKGICTDAEIVIPSFHNNKPVTSIDNNAFSNCTSLISISIPDSVTSVSDQAFIGCTSLKYNQYDNGLYLGNENNPYHVLVSANSTFIESCEIHNNTKIIAWCAFMNCDLLKDINIPDSVTSIGTSAFKECASLTSVKIGNSVTSIALSTFYKCTSLTNITIPTSLVGFGDSSLRYCNSLANIVFEGTVEQWKTIEKGEWWIRDSGNYIVYCTDGTIAKDGTTKYYDN